MRDSPQSARLPRSRFCCTYRQHLLICGAIFAFVLFAIASGNAITTNTPAEFTRTIWHIQNGLPEETVQALAEGPKGYLWVGTTGGLARFDGSRFTNFSSMTSPELPEDNVFSLLVAKDGTLWLSTEGGGLVHYVHGVFHDYSGRQGLTDSFVRCVIQDTSGRFWIGTDKGLFRMVHGVIQHVDTSQVAPGLAVHAIIEDREHHVWVGGSRLLRFEGDKVQEFKLPGAYSQNRVKSILQTKDGTIWVGTVGGLQRLIGNHFVRVPGINGTVRTLRQTSDGTLWIGTIGHGLYTWKHNTLHKIDTRGLLPSNTVLDIIEDSNQQIWIGTQDGLVRLSRTPVRVIPLPGGSDPDYETVSYDQKTGTIWDVATRVYAIRNNRAHPYHFPGMPKVSVRNIFTDRQGTIWIGTDGSGAYHLTSHGIVHYSAPNTLVNNFVRVFLQSRDGSMWIATDQGLSHIVHGHTYNYTMRNGLTYFSTRALMQDHHGNIWIGTDQGLSCWNGQGFVQNLATRALRHDKVWAILQDAIGVIWFGTRNHGLFRYADGKLTQFTTAQGLASNAIYQLLADHRGRFWISSPSTISSIPLKALDDVSLKPGMHLPVTIYNMPYDADNAQLYGGRKPSGCLGPDGGVWFPSNKGAVHVLYQPTPREKAPEILLTNVTVDGTQIAASHFHRLSADASRLVIAFTPLSLQSQDDIRFRYRLVPFDRGWTYAGSSHIATYTNLAAGHYRFYVVAFRLDNPSSTSETVLSFRKDPHFYATWWFLTIAVFVLCLASLGAYRWRVRSLQLRFKAVLNERSRLAREMHDTVIQGCTSISALLEAISSLERENDNLREELLNFARAQVRTTIDEAREAVWNLRHGDEPRQNLSHDVTLLAEQASKEFGTSVECQSDGQRFLIPTSIAHEILMVIREGVYNAVLHGRPSHVFIQLCYGKDDLKCKVSDDGFGFELGAMPADGKPHYGIAGMRERIERLNGKIEWNSTPGQGTSVRFRLRRSSLFPVGEQVEI